MPRKITPSVIWIDGLPYIRCTYGGVRKPRAIYDESGARVRSRTGAELELKRVVSALAAGENPWPESQTLDAWLAGYLRSCKLDDGNAPRTLTEKGKTLGYFVAWAKGRGLTALTDISPEVAKLYLQGLQAEKSTRWRNLSRNYLSHGFKWASLAGMVAVNPFTLTTSIQVLSKPKPTIPIDTLAAVIETAHPHYRLALKFQFYTGVRPGELCALSWADLHLDQRYANIASLKGHKSRPVTFPAAIAGELESLRGALGVGAFLRGATLENGPVFLSGRGNQWTIKTYRFAVGIACKLAGVEAFSPHRLRHTAITEMIRGGADLAAVRDAAGHHSISVTNTYTHSNPVTVRRAFDVLPDLGNGKSNGK